MSLSVFKFMRHTVENLPHCKRLGLTFTQLDEGVGAMQLDPRPEFVGNTAQNFMHSAIVTTLLDTLCGTVASSAYSEGRTVATLDLRLDHLDRLHADRTLYAKAECFHHNDDVAYVRGWAWQDSEDKMVAKATGTFMASGTFKLQKEDML